MSQAPSPLDKIKSDLDYLRRNIDELQRKAAFSDAVRSVTDRAGKLDAMDLEIRRLRGRGWVWDPEWERIRTELAARSGDLIADLRRETASAADRVGRRLSVLETDASRLVPALHVADDIQRLDREKDDIAQDVTQIEGRIDTLVRSFQVPFDELQRELVDADTHLDRFEAAQFKLNAGEHPWLTVDASWEDAPSGKLTGFLYFTDKRIRFEQKETITTKKWLIFTASSEEKHELLLDEPVGSLASSDDTTRGMVFKDQLITLKWASGARYRQTTFDVNTGYAKEWDQRIEDLKAGKLGHLMIETAAANPNAGMPINAPRKCEACDGSLDAPVRGMTVLKCKFCGHRHDLVLG